MATDTTNSVANNYQALLDYANNKKTVDKSQISSAQDRFLKLLTTQLKNQDPMNPLDNAQMTSQLAQISTVTGIEKLYTALQSMMGGVQDAQNTQAAALVGHTVMVPGSALQLTDGKAAGGVELAADADQVNVAIKDSNGLVVKTIAMGAQKAGVQRFTWDGSADNGATAVDGKYTISVAATQGGEKVTATALNFGDVKSVIRDGKGFSLDLGTLGAFTMAEVKQIL